jgi:hypothetical protein
MLGLSVAKFTEQVNEGNLPKGRIGEDGRRYYTDKDYDFLKREWRSKTTGRFLMFTLPVILVVLFLVLATFRELSNYVTSSDKEEGSPTIRPGYAVPPMEIWEPGTPWPTRPPKPTLEPGSQHSTSRYRMLPPIRQEDPSNAQYN